MERGRGWAGKFTINAFSEGLENFALRNLCPSLSTVQFHLKEVCILVTGRGKRGGSKICFVGLSCLTDFPLQFFFTR